MKQYLIFFSFCILMLFSCDSPQNNTDSASLPEPEKAEYAIIIHGGAGYTGKDISEEQKQKYFKMLEDAITVGEGVLKSGGSSLDAVEKTLSFMEKEPFFNAGIGAVFTHEGKNELDASIMDGNTMKAGAVGGVMTIKSPIQAARAVMEKSNHVMLTQRGAEEFAEEVGLEIVDPKYFYTERSWDNLQNVLESEKDKKQGSINKMTDEKFGTVGCAALDKAGNLAAGTSTGGMTNKRWNRIGDSPLIGAGTYANNNTCAVSCTGHGEFFIRYAVAHDLSAKMKYAKMDIKTAAETIINQELKEVGGAGGLVAVDKYGNFAFPYNTGSMFRAYAKPGEKKISIWED
jgi:beta-aspartyl-peptidase (threonine type)